MIKNITGHSLAGSLFSLQNKIRSKMQKLYTEGIYYTFKNYRSYKNILNISEYFQHIEVNSVLCHLTL
jgi:hypothetical protein